MSVSTLTRLSSALFFVALLGLALPDPCVADSDPAMATSGDPDSYTVESGQMDNRLAKSRGPDGLAVGSEDPDDMREGSEDPDSLLTTSGDLDSRVVNSIDLDDLKPATPPAAPGSNRVGGEESDRSQAQPENRVRSYTPSTATGSGGGSWEGKLAVAKARLDGARRDVEHWNAAYSRSVTSNTSLGQARAEIISKRNDAQARVSEAQKELHAIAASARRAGVNPMIVDSFSSSR